jgi:PhnB protein
MQVQTYLQFDGRCEEAINFYKSALGAQLLMMMRFKDAPNSGESAMPGEQVMHATLRIGDSVLMASDGACHDGEGFTGFALTLNMANEAEAHQKFDALADGGKVQMPLAANFFSPCFGMLTDRFGIAWYINVRTQNAGAA